MDREIVRHGIARSVEQPGENALRRAVALADPGHDESSGRRGDSGAGLKPVVYWLTGKSSPSGTPARSKRLASTSKSSASSNKVQVTTKLPEASRATSGMPKYAVPGRARRIDLEAAAERRAVRLEPPAAEVVAGVVPHEDESARGVFRDGRAALSTAGRAGQRGGVADGNRQGVEPAAHHVVLAGSLRCSGPRPRRTHHSGSSRCPFKPRYTVSFATIGNSGRKTGTWAARGMPKASDAKRGNRDPVVNSH